MSTWFAPNIEVEGTGSRAQADAYEAQVVEQLRQLLLFQTGQILLGEITRVPHRLTIRPWPSAQVNADAAPMNWDDGEPRGVPVVDGAGTPIPGLRGTGLGSDTVVRFSPTILTTDAGGWTPAMQAAWQAAGGQAPPPAGAEVTEMLLHELVHAYRYMLGVAHPRRMGLNFDTREEQIAVVVTNVYSLERGLRPLRGDHRPAGSIPDYHRSMATRDYRTTLLGAMLEMPALTNALARVPVTPNLFAQHGTPTIQDLFFGARF